MLNLIYIQISCSHLLLIKWLQGHLLPCPFKYVTGIDCPGCGFQRAVVALIQGELLQGFLFYPPAIPLIIFLIYGAADGIFKLDTKKGLIKKIGFMIMGAIILVSYSIKMYGVLAHHHNASI